jgi:flagellar hook-associated protein FlgK
MTNLSKAFWHSEENSIKLSMPIAKIDKEKRTVSGFATLDNIDKQSDIVPTDVSVKAFERFRGNLREMHMPIAVGRVMSFKSDKFYNQEEDKFYNGVFVNAYISKGAQDTWEKVLDGTLSGFSIGGNIKESDQVYNAEMDKSIRVIKDYELHELSLVDNPANQFANIVSIEKMADGKNKFDGIISKVDLENVYWCESDAIVRLSQEEDSCCPSCDKGMINIGFVESNDTEKNSVVKGLIESQKNRLGEKVTKAENPYKEGNIMAKENVEPAVIAEENIIKSEGTEEVTPAQETAPAEEAAPAEETAPAEEAAPVEETAPAEEAATVEAEAPAQDAATPAEEAPAEEAPADLAKAVDTVQESIDEVQNTVASALGDLVATVKSLNDKMAELQKNIASAQEEIKGIKGNVNEFGKRVDELEDDTAIRKSGDLGGVVQETQITRKSMWGGRFLNSADLYR